MGERESFHSAPLAWGLILNQTSTRTKRRTLSGRADGQPPWHVNLSMLAAAMFLMVVGSERMQVAPDATAVDLKDGYIRITTKDYEIDIPKEWRVEEETPWGARAMRPKQGRGELGVMTAPPSERSWDDLYRTSLYFILREERGEATPYTLTKTKRGYEAAQFSVLDDKGFAKRRYVLIREKSPGLLALSVKVPNKEADAEWQKHFSRMVESATFR